MRYLSPPPPPPPSPPPTRICHSISHISSTCRSILFLMSLSRFYLGISDDELTVVYDLRVASLFRSTIVSLN